MSETMIENYEILAEIGRGGMGTVYRAMDRKNQREVAIKVLPKEFLNDLGIRARFEREAHTIARLRHPAIVPVFDQGEHNGQPYLVMRYMTNGSLADRLREGALPVESAERIILRIAEALDYAHAQGVVHRDLKPSNILFDENDEPFLSDFGIALEGNIVRSLAGVSGTPAYMSPEQALGAEAIGRQSDIYSLGVILYEIVTSEAPFQGDSPIAILMQHLYDPPASARAVNPDVDHALDSAILRALSKDPDARYALASDFAVAVREASSRVANGTASIKATPIEDSSARRQLDTLTSGYEMVPRMLPGFGSSLDTLSGPAGEPGSAEGPSSSSGRPLIPHSVRRTIAMILAIWLGVACAAAAVIWIRASLRPVDTPSTQVPQIASLDGIEFAADLASGFGHTPPAATRQETSVAAAPEAAEQNIRMVYGLEGFSIINISNSALSLADVTFRRVSKSGEQTASFNSSYWSQVANPPIDKLPPGGCYQLVRLRQTGSLLPGSDPDLPAECSQLHGWLAAYDWDWYFWVPDVGSLKFQILQGDQVLQTCVIADGLCAIHLPEPGIGE